MAALEKAVITNTVTGDRIPVQFNPEEYTLSRDINYAQAAIPGRSAPLIQFAHGQLQTLEMELLLDTWEAHRGSGAGQDVRPLARKITDLMNLEPSTHAPPVLLFTWGSLTFTCLLTRASQRFLMFRPDGIPVRVRLQVTFSEFRNSDQEPREVKRETANYAKAWTVCQGETLSLIAARIYGDAAAWRPLALRNRVADPRDLPAGLVLAVPQLPFIDPRTGEVLA
jgi:nucleoid-associated protein YgaU